MSKIKITLDGKEVEVEAGERLLDVCRREHAFIPTLCDNDDLKPYGSCRMCLVECESDGKKKMVASCTFPVTAGIKVTTDSEKVKTHRKMVIEWTLARASKTPEVIELAKRLGVDPDASRFSKKEEGCILCGMCIRACGEVVGAHAISFVDRGPQRKVSSPFDDEAKDCIGCGSCVYVCPTGFIKMEEDAKSRTFPQWKAKFEFAMCKKCGQKVATKKQIEFFKSRAKIPDGWFDLCQDCRDIK